MDRLKELGIWVLLVIAFFLFSNGLIYIFLHGGENTNTKKTNTMVVNQIK